MTPDLILGKSEPGGVRQRPHPSVACGDAGPPRKGEV